MCVMYPERPMRPVGTTIKRMSAKNKNTTDDRESGPLARDLVDDLDRDNGDDDD